MATSRTSAEQEEGKDMDPKRNGHFGRACVLVLSGSPGAGKTTFARRFARFLEEEEEGGKKVLTVHVCYDEVVSRERQADMATAAAAAAAADSKEEEKEHSDWKRIRLAILNRVRTHLSRLLGHPPAGDGSDPDSDDPGLAGVSAAFDRAAETAAGSVGPPPPDLVVMVDDNNYLRSMRHEYFRLARSLNVGFCQLHFPSSLLERRLADEARPPGERVPSEAAEAMERRMEPPEPGRNAWERFSFSVRTFQGERGERVKDLPFEMCRSALELSLSNPESEAPDTSEERARDRAACDASLVHQADRLLRRRVGAAMRDGDAAVSGAKEDRAAHARRLNAARAELLEDLRTGSASLSSSSSSPLSVVAGEEDKLAEELGRLFQQKLTAVTAREEDG